MTSEKLDNPAWYSLTEAHREFAIDYDGVKFYKVEYCPFGGFMKPERVQAAIDLYADLSDDFFVIGERPAFGNQLILNNELVCMQMILTKPINVEIKEQIIALESQDQKSELFDLVNLVQPGYFKPNTSDLGNYFGIYKNKTLIAVTGERMKMDAYSEVSAVVTHPEYTGRGYAKQLIAHTSNLIFQENKIPYLHVASANIGPISLYEKLGFEKRREISFWHLRHNKSQQNITS